MTSSATPDDVLGFWFDEIHPKSWWKAEPGFDALVQGRFGQLLDCAAQGGCVAWRDTHRGRLAEIIVLDQFSRNIHRGTPAAFAQDPLALALAQQAVAMGTHLALPPAQRTFVLLPYMHSESRDVHAVAEALYREHGQPDDLRSELDHKAIIDRFGRYPHRNEVLGRVSTAEELAFLQLPGSRF